jgi:murein L,D-transpeptidase YcbB/YkuD
MVVIIKMRKTIYKYSLLISALAFSFFIFSFPPFVLADNYGANPYSYGIYSATIPSSGGTSTTQAYRDKFVAEQKALALQQTNTGTPASTTSTSLNITKTLKLKMKGTDVKTLQTYLNTHGYNCGTIDGKFGSKTKISVIKFQKANSLVSDGIVGPKTREKMK